MVYASRRDLYFFLGAAFLALVGSAGAAAAGAAVLDFMTFFTIFCSSTRKARTMLLKKRGMVKNVFNKMLVSVPVADAMGATRTTISTVDGLLVLSQTGILGGAEGRHTIQSALAVTTLGLSSLLILVDVGELTT